MVERQETDADVDCNSEITPEEWLHIAMFRSLSTSHWITPTGEKTPVACLAIVRGVRLNDAGYFVDEGAVRLLLRLLISELGYAQVHQYREDCARHPLLVIYRIQNKMLYAYTKLHEGLHK